MRTPSGRSFILSAILYVVGCNGNAGQPALGDGTSVTSGGSTMGSNTNPNGGNTNTNGGNTNTGHANGTGGKAVDTKANGGTSTTSGSDASGGRNVGSGGGSGNATGGRNGEGGSSSPSTGGASQGGANTGKGGSSSAVGGGAPRTGGASATGGNSGAGGIGPAPGGRSPVTGGTKAAGGTSTGGTKTTTGGVATGGNTPSAGAAAIDCNAPMPTGGQQHSGNSQGGKDNLAWQIWSNQGSGTLTTFSTPAFSGSWNNSGDYLGRLGFEWGNGGKTYDAYGTITAQFTFKKTGTGGSFSYIGIYGWSTNPCVEWYIIDDSFNAMPFTPWNSSAKGSPTSIDGENYKFYSNSTNGTGGSRCNQSSWSQFWSVRQKARQCGTITISDHFKAWDAAGMKLGNLLEAKILVETGGGSGTVDFPVANVTKTQ